MKNVLFSECSLSTVEWYTRFLAHLISTRCISSLHLKWSATLFDPSFPGQVRLGLEMKSVSMVEGKTRHSNIALSLESKVFILPPRTISHRNAELKTCAMWATARSFPFRQEETQMGSPRLTEALAYVDRDGFFCGLIQMRTDSYLCFSFSRWLNIL